MMSMRDENLPEYRLCCRYRCVEKDEMEEVPNIREGDRVRANVNKPVE